MPCSRHSSATATPPSAWRKIARIWASLYLDSFIKISSGKMPRKFYLSIPLISGGITLIRFAQMSGVLALADLVHDHKAGIALRLQVPGMIEGRDRAGRIAVPADARVRHEFVDFAF